MSAAGRPAIAVVAATRNRAGRLAGLLGSLEAQSLEPGRFEVVVVDDGSTDDTRTVLEQATERGRLALTAVRAGGEGPARARNLGWRAARAPLVAFTDDDCEADPGWLEAMLALAQRHPGAIVQGPTTPIPAERERLGPFSRTRRIEEPGPWYETCNILYPRELLERLGGFDERYPEPLGEDTDLGWRAREQGTELVWAPDARVHHAVDEVGAAGILRATMIGADAVAVFDRHPELRRTTLRWGVVRNPSLPRLGLALCGIALARHRRPAALLALPYARDLAGRARRDGTSNPAIAAFYVATDLAHLYTSVRGSIRHGMLVL